MNTVGIFMLNPLRCRRDYTVIRNILKFILRHMHHILGLNNMPNSHLSRFWQLKCNIRISSNSHILVR